MPRKTKNEDATEEEVVDESPEPEEEQKEESESTTKVKSENRGRHIKYMGFSDRRILNPGETIMGAVKDPLAVPLEWNPQNKHTLNTAEHPDVKDEFWDELCKLGDWQDVTAEVRSKTKEVPKNNWEKTWSKESLQSDRLWTPPPARIE